MTYRELIVKLKKIRNLDKDIDIIMVMDYCQSKAGIEFREDQIRVHSIEG